MTSGRRQALTQVSKDVLNVNKRIIGEMIILLVPFLPGLVRDKFVDASKSFANPE